MSINDWSRVPSGLFHHFHQDWSAQHVIVPLEPTYETTWDASPEEMRIAVETGVVPEPEAE
jgi:hypothetical protein